MKIVGIFLLIFLNAAFASNSCKQPYKYNIGEVPYYANQYMIDSMIDASGRMAHFKYDLLNRVASENEYVFTYSSDSHFFSIDTITKTQSEYFDNGNMGYDSIYRYEATGITVVQKVYMRFSALFDVFEYRGNGDFTNPQNYDSLAYVSQDSLVHYHKTLYTGNYYEFVEYCKSTGDSCNCKLSYSSPGYPYTISTAPLLIYENSLLKTRRDAVIYYKSLSSSSISSLIQGSSSDPSSISASSSSLSGSTSSISSEASSSVTSMSSGTVRVMNIGALKIENSKAINKYFINGTIATKENNGWVSQIEK